MSDETFEGDRVERPFHPVLNPPREIAEVPALPPCLLFLVVSAQKTLNAKAPSREGAKVLKALLQRLGLLFRESKRNAV